MLAFLLLFGWVSSAQAVHIHGKWLPRVSHALQGPALDAGAVGGETHCPLCMAASPALPFSFQVLALLLAVVALLLPHSEVFFSVTPWHPCRLSRPPPMAS